ncbi:serine- kinase ATM isoform X1, partial [Paramuricea clavata]
MHSDGKKNAENIKQLLRQAEILRLLDSNSDGGKKNVISWDFVQKSIETYVVREIECLRAQKPRNSQTSSSIVANNREKKRQEVMSLFKFVIKTADERDRCRLNGKDLVHHVITTLKSQNKAFVTDYQNILLKYVLTSRIYCCELTSQMWR